MRKPLEVAVVATFDFGGKAAAREFAHLQVITEALTAHPVLAAAGIRASTKFGVAGFFAFHENGLDLRRPAVNPPLVPLSLC